MREKLLGGAKFIAKILRLDLDQLSKEVGGVAPFLIPFLKMSCVYFVLDLPENESCLTAAFVKVLPILSLAWLVCLQGIGIGETPNDYIVYNRLILCALLVSSVGDVILVWQSQDEMYFLLGMAVFACVQMVYTFAFGFSPFGLKEFILSFVVWVIIVVTLLFHNPPGMMYYIIPIYASLIGMMAWRSLARFTLQEGDIPWRKIFSSVGAILFVVSDTNLAFNRFCFSLPFEKAVTMTTYYGAQLCMALSVVNSHLHRDSPLPPLIRGSSVECGNTTTTTTTTTHAPHHAPHHAPQCQGGSKISHRKL